MLATVALSIQAQRYLLFFARSSRYRALFVTEGCQLFGNCADQQIKSRMRFCERRSWRNILARQWVNAP